MSASSRARPRVLRIEIDGAGQRDARAGLVAELGRDLAPLEQVVPQAGRVVGRAAQLVEDRRELDERAAIEAQLDQRDAGLVVVRIGDRAPRDRAASRASVSPSATQ